MRQEEKDLIPQEHSGNTNNFIDDFITIGELRKMLEPFNDDEYITVTKGHADLNHKITHIEDSTAFGFWELRIK